MSNKGGRGNKAPYESTHVRVPVPIKAEVEKLINEFKLGIDGHTENLLTGLIEVDEAVKIAQGILKQKKSARVSVEKLLTALYNTEIKL